MAAFPCRLSKLYSGVKWTRFRQLPVNVQNARQNHMFQHLGRNKEHDTEYEYEISNDPNEWKFVERLRFLETVPTPTPKNCYPSGWRPPLNEALQLPYFVERTKNHMLSVYLEQYQTKSKVTKLKKIHGDLWKLYQELKAHIENVEGKKIASFVHEGNNAIVFKGDHVYVVEQWLLSKGF